jgi:hypothetical protein
MKTVFYTTVSDSHYYGCGTPKFINSFKHFHPDIELIVFRQDMIDRVFKEKNINFYKAKPTFAKLLTPYYDLIVNIDADTVVLGRLERILKGDFDIACPTNLNDYENMSIENVTKEMFIQAGLVAVTNKKIWDIWEKANKDAMKYLAQENTILNLLWYNHPEISKMNRLILDKDKDYYGCKSLNREREFYMKDGQVMCRDERVYLYHHAKGGGAMPKLVYETMGFPKDVVNFMNVVSEYGKSVRYGSL